MPAFSDKLKALLWGQPFGDVQPPRPDPVPPAFDGRTAALKVLQLYLSELTFYRAGEVGGPLVAFQVPRAQIKIEPADDADDGQMPALAFVPGDGASEALGLGAYVEETSKDVYGPGTVVQWQSEYAETFTIEVTARSRAERRALVAGIVRAMSPTEFMYGVRFIMPDYFNQLVVFTIQRRTLSRDFATTVKRRYLAEVQVEMRLTEVALQNYVDVQPTLAVDTKAAGGSFDPATPDVLADDGSIVVAAGG